VGPPFPSDEASGGRVIQNAAARRVGRDSLPAPRLPLKIPQAHTAQAQERDNDGDNARAAPCHRAKSDEELPRSVAASSKPPPLSIHAPKSTEQSNTHRPRQLRAPASRNMNTLRTTALVSLSRTLANARRPCRRRTSFTAGATYHGVSSGQTAALDPDDLHTAKENLDLARARLHRDGDTSRDSRTSRITADGAPASGERKGAAIAAGQRSSKTLRRHARRTTAQVQKDIQAAWRANSSRPARPGHAQPHESSQILTEQERRRRLTRAREKQRRNLDEFAGVRQAGSSRTMVITSRASVLLASAKWDIFRGHV